MLVDASSPRSTTSCSSSSSSSSSSTSSPASLPSSPDSNGTQSGEGRGTWTKEEHERFLSAIEMYPNGPWKAIAEVVHTRTIRQTQTHAQKYREKLARRNRGLRAKTLVSDDVALYPHPYFAAPIGGGSSMMTFVPSYPESMDYIISVLEKEFCL
ncbi:hypothetical protein SDRG_16552 [Saprolegnia diclina VS20]|uniref:Uncharacterized protein n=1 Tax=Saprolegnia diclina (strain VS20) TaxID=1156394 RepID=T0R7W1_SAPDV|nr:hypothetical protein SDRG_16552 [Saprolegnia diclina VS20]EQC25582.1 hypothetical protein SDRG_16552 [Saprolegnia diclina VS20]|eukprot:XP_008620989.1 hypothetical protein SDRG_16552 [Saprolegnia diclina VS20]